MGESSGGGGVDVSKAAGLHLLPLLSLLVFVIPALLVVLLPVVSGCLRRSIARRRLPAPPASPGLAAVYPLRWVYRCVGCGGWVAVCGEVWKGKGR